MTENAHSEGGADETQGLKSWYHLVQIPEFPIDYRATALIVIDLQYQQAKRGFGLFAKLEKAGLSEDAEYALSRIEDIVVPSVKRLIEAFREHGAPIIYTRCASLRGDGSDQTWRHRAFGLVCTVDSQDAQILDEIAPTEGDILLTKTGSSVFNSTNVEHLLRNMGITTLVMTGVWTNSCVESATRDAGDRDFRVVIVEDGCAAMSPAGHKTALAYLDKNFCHVKSTAEVIELLAASWAVESEMPVVSAGS
jgi:nicotinamidase-related amidase